MITWKQSINGLISVTIFKRARTNISFNITYLQDNYLGTYVSIYKFMTDTQMVAVLTYLCTMCFLLRESMVNTFGVSTQLQSSGLVAHENSTFRNLALAVSGPFMA